MTGAGFDGALVAASLQVGGDLLMDSGGQSKASFKRVILRRAKISGQVAMVGASFGGAMSATYLKVGGDLFMFSDDENKTSFKEVHLDSARITGQLGMDRASFNGKLTAEAMQVGSDMFMRGINCAHEVDMVFAHVGTNVDLRGATLASLDLSGASIAGDLRLGEPGKPAVWKGKNGDRGALNLRNAHVGNLMDLKDAWPAHGQLHLDGFSFNHLGGSKGETEPEMRGRGMDWWDNWARRDPGYSPTPYAQLAAALTSAGDRDAANDIRYFGRERTRRGL